MSLLDRIAERRGEQRTADVPAMIAQWQQRPLAYTSQGVLPDTGGLAQWMAAQMASSGGLKITK